MSIVDFPINKSNLGHVREAHSKTKTGVTQMATITTSEIASKLNISIADVALNRAAAFSRHIVIKGRAYCGRIDNDGYSIPTERTEADVDFVCGTCMRRYTAKVAA